MANNTLLWLLPYACLVANLPKPKVGTHLYKVDIMVIIAWRDSNRNPQIFGGKWDCPSEIGTVVNYTLLGKKYFTSVWDSTRL